VGGSQRRCCARRAAGAAACGRAAAAAAAPPARTRRRAACAHDARRRRRAGGGVGVLIVPAGVSAAAAATVARGPRPVARSLFWSDAGARGHVMIIAAVLPTLMLLPLLWLSTVAAASFPQLVEYEHRYCLTHPEQNDFVRVDGGSLQACMATCSKLRCACFDYSTHVWAKGKCRVVAAGKNFSLGQSCLAGNCEMAFVPGGVPGAPGGVTPHDPPPPPPPAPPPVPPPSGGRCEWDPTKATGAPDEKTACKVMGPDVGVTAALTNTHVNASNVTHVDIQTVLYRTEAPLVDPKTSMVKVAAIPAGGCNGCDFYNSPGSKNCSEQFSLLDLAGSKGADVAVLPEEFLWNPSTAPPSDCDMSATQNCSIINFLGNIAKKHNMYIVFGMRAAAPADDPYPVDPTRGTEKLGYNTDVILDRHGEMVGYYRKAWPCCPSPSGTTMNDGYPSREMVKTFDLDFGRVGLQTCFDMNFDDTWHQLYAANVDMVFWPSAYGGGMPIRGYAALYHYNIVPVGWGDITDITGQVAQGLTAVVPQKLYMATLDLDRTFTHDDFIGPRVQQLVADHKGLVQFLSVPEYCDVAGHCAQQADLVRESGFYLLGRTQRGYEKGLSVRALLQQYNIETLRQYQHRSRAAINMQRQAAAPHPTLLKRNNTAGGHFSLECKYNAQNSTKATRFGGNSTCESLVPDSDATVTLEAKAANGDSPPLSDVLYADTRTTIYTAPPAAPADPKKSRIKVASIVIPCCVSKDKVDSALTQGLAKLNEAANMGVDVALLPEEFMCGGADCSLDLHGPEVAQLQALAKNRSMWIVFGMRATAPADDPYPLDPARGTKKLGYNTDVILDRRGEIVGYYRKAWPCCPGPDGRTMDDG
jgi:predicted amidohydrolase